jgi:prophage regulatory protein
MGEISMDTGDKPADKIAVPVGASILRLPAVLKRVGLSRSSVYKMLKEQQFPASTRVGKSAVGWLDSQIQAFIEARANGKSWQEVAAANDQGESRAA